MASPAEVAGSLLDDQIVGGVTGWTLKIGGVPDSPDNLVVMTDTGGLNPNPRWLVDFVMVQAVIRGGVNGYGDAYAKARQVRDKLLGLDSVTVSNGDRWVSVIVVGDIASIGYDQRERPLLSINFRIIIEPTSGDNREAL